MNDNKFQAYVKSLKWSAALSNFLDHAGTDHTLPDAQSWGELEAYLKDHDAAEGVIKSAEYVWGLYEADKVGGKA